MINLNINGSEHSFQLPPEDSTYRKGINIVRRLKENGYEAFFVGGWVRDLVSGKPSADIDITTNASMQEIKRLFTVKSPVGLNYGIAYVEQEDEKFEVVSFKKSNGLLEDDKPGTMEEDAKRRDFTVNALFFDPMTKKVYDYVGGLQDLLYTKQIRAIGDPGETLEDRSRMLRAIRFSCKLDFPLEQALEEKIKDLSHDLFSKVSKASAAKELLKLFQGPKLETGIMKLYELGLLQTIFPASESLTVDEIQLAAKRMDQVPKQMPFIVFVLQLFPNASRKQMEQLCKSFEIPPKLGVSVVQNYFRVKEFAENTDPKTLFDWATIHTIENASSYLNILGVKDIPPKETIDQALDKLKVCKNLVTPKILQDRGVKGQMIRDLLSQAERVAFDHDLKTTEEVIEYLF